MKKKDVSSKLIRIGKILKMFIEKDKVHVSTLAKEFDMDVRTIQRDLDALKKAGVALVSETQGCYRMEKHLVKQYETFSDIELALIIATKNVLDQLGPAFVKASDSIFNSLYKTIGEQTESPVFIKIDSPVMLEGSLISKIAKSIRGKRRIKFEYTVYSPFEAYVEPYKIVYFDGVWYLVALDIKADKVKNYALDKMNNIKLQKETYTRVPGELNEMLENAANIWFTHKKDTTVEILVDSEAAKHFKRRKIHPTQEIPEERQDGSLIVSFRVGRFEEIRPILQRWLPYIKILKPAKLQDELLEEMKQWIKWQES